MVVQAARWLLWPAIALGSLEMQSKHFDALSRQNCLVLRAPGYQSHKAVWPCACIVLTQHFDMLSHINLMITLALVNGQKNECLPLLMALSKPSGLACSPPLSPQAASCYSTVLTVWMPLMHLSWISRHMHMRWLTQRCMSVPCD